MIHIRKYRRSNREGWEVDIHAEVDGRRVRMRRKSPHPARDATRRWAEGLLSALIRKGLPSGVVPKGPPRAAPASTPTVRELAPAFLEWSRSMGQKPSSVHAKDRILINHIFDWLGDTPIGSVGPAEIERLRAGLACSGKTANNVLSTLSAMLRYAAEVGVIEKATRVRLGKVGVGEAEWYPPAEYEALVRAAGNVGELELLIVLLGGDAGMRAGEMIGLEHGDLRAGKRAAVVIARNVWEGQAAAPKGGRSRVVPLTPRLVDAIAGVPVPLHDRATTRVLSREDATVTHRWLQAAVKRVERAAGMTQTGRVHILRHTFCARLVAAGVHPHVIQKLAGHADITTTLRYMHAGETAEDDAIAALGTGAEQSGPVRVKSRKRARSGG